MDNKSNADQNNTNPVTVTVPQDTTQTPSSTPQDSVSVNPTVTATPPLTTDSAQIQNNTSDPTSQSTPVSPVSNPISPNTNPPNTEVTTVVTSPHAPQKYGGKKIIATIFGLLLVIGGVGAGVVLVQRQQNVSEKAQTIQRMRYDAQCSEILVYDQNWNQLSITDLRDVAAGSVVRFTVSGISSTGSFDKARFTINGIQTPEVTDKKPGTEEFYYEYTLPEDVTNYTIDAQVHHSVFGWI